MCLLLALDSLIVGRSVCLHVLLLLLLLAKGSGLIRFDCSSLCIPFFGF